MAIKIKCDKCGFQNDLGRMFCVQCGRRLELTHTSLDELASKRKIEWRPILRRVLTGLGVVAVAGVIGAAFWPPSPAKVLVDPAGVKQIPSKTQALQKALRARQRVSLEFAEAELNGFLEERAKSRKLHHLTIDLKPGEFDLAAGHRWVPITAVAALTNLVLPVSCELTAGFKGGTLAVKGGRFGHIPLPAPAASLMTPWFTGWFDDVLARTNLVEGLQSVTLEEDKATLVFGP